MKRKLDSGKENKLRLAQTFLTVALMHVHQCASGTKPFKASKFLNILAKGIGDLRMEIIVFLGDVKLDEVGFALPDWNSRKILKALLLEEGAEK